MIKKEKEKETTEQFCTEKRRDTARAREKRQRTNLPEWRTDEVREVFR